MPKVTKLFNEFFESEKAGGLLLLFCTVVSLIFANSFLQKEYFSIWHFGIAGSSFEHWINDGLMSVFFLLIGLELERELYIGELSKIKNAVLPFIAAVGGIILPAGIHLALNAGSTTQAGAGIPMATDIAFALGILSLLGKRVPLSLKIFLTAFAVIDDLGAIIVIAVFYTNALSILNLGIAFGIFFILLLLNRLKVYSLIPYLIGGFGMWYFILHSGVHATIAGVLLAFAIPFRGKEEKSPSEKLLHFLHKPVAFFILPLFALANTAIEIKSDLISNLVSANSLGIFLGLLIGKPIGITLFSFIAVTLGLSSLPGNVKMKEIIGVGFLGGIGFTMSIFITLLAFNDEVLISSSKLTILVTSAIAAIIGFLILHFSLKPLPDEITIE